VRVPVRLGSAMAIADPGLAAAAALLFAAAEPALAGTASPASPAFGSAGASQAVFAQTDNTSGNHVVADHRATDGVLSQAGTYATGGVGGDPGRIPPDHLASQGHLVIAEAGTNALATFSVAASGTVGLIDAVPTGAGATRWVAPAGSFLYASDAGSATEGGFTSSAGGQLTLLGVTQAGAGNVDASAAAGGRVLYVQAGGSGIVDEFSVGSTGSLTEIGSATVPGAPAAKG
jgi:hypothetical protein